MILSLLSDSSKDNISDKIFDDLILFGKKILKGGNKEVQKSIYNYFINNTSSEVFFKRIHEKITDEISRLKLSD